MATKRKKIATGARPSFSVSQVLAWAVAFRRLGGAGRIGAAGTSTGPAARPGAAWAERCEL